MMGGFAGRSKNIRASMANAKARMPIKNRGLILLEFHMDKQLVPKLPALCALSERNSRLW
jgi:hypothetical protein